MKPAVALVALLPLGCAMADIGEGEEEPGLEEIEFAADNGIFLDNGLNLANGLNLGNGITGPYYAPPSGSGLEQWIDVDPGMRKKVLRYLVECALPAGLPVQLQYRGALETLGYGIAGLGPSLQTGPMSEVDQERVTACMLARMNGTGRTVQINMFGPMGAGSGFETAGAADQAFPVLEAAFWGNLFATVPRAYACQQDYYALADTRSCRDTGNGTADCGVIEFANEICGAYLGDVAICQFATTTDAASWTYYQDCYADSHIWRYALTTYLKPKRDGEVCTVNEDCASGYCDGACVRR